MKKFVLLAVTLSIAFSILLVPLRTYAFDPLGPVCSATGAQSSLCGGSNQNGTNPIFALMTILIQILTFIVGLAAVITIIIAGLRMITSSGDPNTVATARRAILYAVVGLAIAALSQTVIIFVLSKLNKQ